MEPADECYSVKLLESVKYYPRVCEILPFRSQGRSTLLFDYDFGMVRLPRGWAARVPAHRCHLRRVRRPLACFSSRTSLRPGCGRVLPSIVSSRPEGDSRGIGIDADRQVFDFDAEIVVSGQCPPQLGGAVLCDLAQLDQEIDILYSRPT